MTERVISPKLVPNSRIYPAIDFIEPGKRAGYLYLPYASNDAAEGRIGIPAGVIANGLSPTVILMSGTHGDEYESQLIVRQLFHSLDPAKITGRIIFLPASNFPAVKNGTRFSPLDNGNLNGSFINEPAKGPTYTIAHYLENALFPMADLVVDLHAGGKTLSYLPGVHIPLDDDNERMKKLCGLATAFNSAAKYIFDFKGSHSMFAAAKRQGTYVIGAELGGGLNPISKGMRIGKIGVLNLLDELGIHASSKHKPANDEIAQPQTFLLIQGAPLYGFAKQDGLFAHAVALGATVKKDQIAGRMHDLNLEKPVTYHFESDGILVCRRAITLSKTGDCLWHMARPVLVEDGTITQSVPGKLNLMRYSYG